MSDVRLDTFIDLTAPAIPAAAAERALERWQQPEHLGAIAGRVRIVTRLPVSVRPAAGPVEWSFAESTAPVAELNAALEAAGATGAALLILTGLVDVGVEAIGVLRQHLERDPMFGFAVPRVSCRDRCCIARLVRNGLGPREWLPRRVLGELPAAQLLLETASPCLLVARDVTRNFGPLDAGFEAAPAALLEYMAAARRCGFRTVCCNRAVVSLEGLRCDALPVEPVPALSAADASLLGRDVPDLARSWDQFRSGSAERFEALYAAVPRSGAREPRPSLLMDVRNLAPLHNGTTHALLGLLGAFKELAGEWTVSLLASDEGARFHDLARRYSEWPIYTSVPDRAFTIAFRPSQPWHIQEMVDLHSASIINAYLLLDTIAWDVAYCAPAHLEGVWQFLASQSDGLLYDSEFTRRRFLERFPAGAEVPGSVTHFSFDPADYVHGGAAAPGTPDGYVLIVGNHLDHKDVRQTARTLASGFPYRHIKVLGPADIVSPFVSSYQSGALAAGEIHSLYAGASYVVYPSFYEGFGFPILTALAYGRTVLVRRSALVEELAPLCRGSGRLVTYERRDDLVELIGRLSAGQPVPELPITGRESAPPRRWRDVARDTDQFLTTLVRDSSPERWLVRDRTVSQLISYRT